eukprot:scaffold19639_cov65-Phaeocystis_antarctica.AAC.2
MSGSPRKRMFLMNLPRACLSFSSSGHSRRMAPDTAPFRRSDSAPLPSRSMMLKLSRIMVSLSPLPSGLMKPSRLYMTLGSIAGATVGLPGACRAHAACGVSLGSVCGDQRESRGRVGRLDIVRGGHGDACGAKLTKSCLWPLTSGDTGACCGCRSPGEASVVRSEARDDVRVAMMCVYLWGHEDLPRTGPGEPRHAGMAISDTPFVTCRRRQGLRPRRQT